MVEVTVKLTKTFQLNTPNVEDIFSRLLPSKMSMCEMAGLLTEVTIEELAERAILENGVDSCEIMRISKT